MTGWFYCVGGCAFEFSNLKRGMCGCWIESAVPCMQQPGFAGSDQPCGLLHAGDGDIHFLMGGDELWVTVQLRLQLDRTSQGHQLLHSLQKEEKTTEG